MRTGNWASEGGPQASKTEVALSAVVVRCSIKLTGSSNTQSGLGTRTRTPQTSQAVKSVQAGARVWSHPSSVRSSSRPVSCPMGSEGTTCTEYIPALRSLKEEAGHKDMLTGVSNDLATTLQYVTPVALSVRYTKHPLASEPGMQCCPPPSAASSSSAAPTATSSRAAHTARAAAAAEAAGAPLQYWHQCPHHHFACCYPGRCHHHPHGSHGLNQAAEKRDGNSAPEGGPQASKTEVALSVVRCSTKHTGSSNIQSGLDTRTRSEGCSGGAGRGCVPLISQSIDSDSVIIQVNRAGDPRHVVTLVGLRVKIAEPY
eukprot:Em0609g2a